MNQCNRASVWGNVSYETGISLYLFSYDNDGTTRDEIKERFCLTMEFVENYLREVVSQNIPFNDREKNKLTFEVRLSWEMPLTRCNGTTFTFTFLHSVICLTPHYPTCEHSRHTIKI